MKRLIVGITGASGAIYGIRALEMLKGSEIESHLILSPAAKATIAQETDYKVSNVIALASVNHDHRDVGASIASGSFITMGMLIAPCSIKTLSGCQSFSADLMGAPPCLSQRRSPAVAHGARDSASSRTHSTHGASRRVGRDYFSARARVL